MKYAKQWLLTTVVGLGVVSVWVGSGRSQGGGSAAVETSRAIAESPAPTPTPDELSAMSRRIESLLLDYDTQAINSILLAAQMQAQEQGKQPLDIVLGLQRTAANNYVFEVRNGTGPQSEAVRRQAIRDYANALVAEAVIRKGKPMQVVNIDESAVICLLAERTTVDVGGACNGSR